MKDPVKHLNVVISEEALRIARMSAARDGIFLRQWVERLIVQNEEHRKRLFGPDRKGMSR